MSELSRREWLERVGGSGMLGVAARRAHVSGALLSPSAQPDAILPLTSTSEVEIPPRGRAYMKFSFDFPEPSIELDGLRFGFLVFTYENAYALDGEAMTVQLVEDGIDLVCTAFSWAGGQEKAPGGLQARLRRVGGFIEWDIDVEMERPVRAVTSIVRGVPRGRLSCAGQPFYDPEDDEVLFGYPFSGGDLFGPGAARGMPTPFAMVERSSTEIFFLSSLDDKVRSKRFYSQPGETAYRVECVHETEGWERNRSITVPTWRVGQTRSIAAAASAHFDHLEAAYRIPRWDVGADVPDWLREVALVVTLHGMHFTGYIFNNYARMLEILAWIATRIPASRVIAFLASWDGRYYWDYPLYEPSDRMGGDRGFRKLIHGGQELGFRMMPMFGGTAANRRKPAFARISDASTEKVDGDRFDLNWVDWENDRHQDGWLSYMNLGVDSWRTWLKSRIAEVLERYEPDAYFLDIIGGWVNNPRADMHEGARKLIEELRADFPNVLAVGEMHYDALLSFLPFYHSFSQTEVAEELKRYARFFQHLSHPAPGRGSTGVHEAGFRRWDPETLSLRSDTIPTLNVVDDTFEANRPEMEMLIEAAKRRVGL